MYLVCPCCSARIPLDAAVSDEAARTALARALAHGPLGRRVVGYLGLFRTPKGALQWGRVARLLDELLDAVEAGTVRRRGRDWAAPVELWRAGLEVVLARRDEGRLDLPLRDHAYLYEVVTGLSDKAEATVEREREAARRQRAAHPATPGSAAAAPGVTVNVHEQILGDAIRLGVERDADGLIRPTRELIKAVMAARREGDGDGDG